MSFYNWSKRRSGRIMCRPLTPGVHGSSLAQRLHSSFSLKSSDFVPVAFRGSSLAWGRRELKPIYYYIWIRKTYFIFKICYTLGFKIVKYLLNHFKGGRITCEWRGRGPFRRGLTISHDEWWPICVVICDEVIHVCHRKVLASDKLAHLCQHSCNFMHYVSHTGLTDHYRNIVTMTKLPSSYLVMYWHFLWIKRIYVQCIRQERQSI